MSIPGHGAEGADPKARPHLVARRLKCVANRETANPQLSGIAEQGKAWDAGKVCRQLSLPRPLAAVSEVAAEALRPEDAEPIDRREQNIGSALRRQAIEGAAETTKAECANTRLVETERTAGANRRAWQTDTLFAKDGWTRPGIQAPHSAANMNFRGSRPVVRPRSDQRSVTA